MMYSAMGRLGITSLSPRLSPIFLCNTSALSLGSRSTLPTITTCNLPSLLTVPMSPLHTSSVVERARQSTRIKKRKVNVANKKKKEERLRKNPPPIPKKVQLMLISKGLGAKPQPWRKTDSRPFPVDTAWCEMYHTWARQEVGEVLECLRENCHPSMLNMPDALVWAKLEFNLQNVKKDKYLDGFTKMVPVYNPFERGVAEKVILAFCKQPEEIKAAEAAGATKAGGIELVEEIVKGKTDVSDFDHFLCTDEMLIELKPLIGVLRDKFPKKILGSVSPDIAKLVQTFAHGMQVAVNKPKKTLGFEEDPAYGVTEVQIGRLNQSTDQIEGNLTTLLQTLRENAPKRAKGGFVTRCELFVEGPQKSRFSVIHDLVDDERYTTHAKERMALNNNNVKVDTKLETIKEEVEI
eukprot:GFUD01032285.1.p1 GENE.GFUD01032285.1~~GFUD01032285.1.p1  ORF type:complete len:408 (+),score=116.95 GFUD01032285.1:61-1284(+)